MSRYPFLSPDSPLPRPYDPDRADAVAADLLAAGRAAGGALESFMDAFIAEPDALRLVRALAGNSPFLAQAILRDPEILLLCADKGLDRTFADIRSAVEGAWRGAPATAALMKDLRDARGRAAVVAAVGDLTGRWRMESVTGALSDFADAAVSATVRHQLAATAAHAEDPAAGSGYVVLAMGKLGSRELNYSSDIDLIVLFDRARAAAAGIADPSGVFVRVTREVVRMLQERTGDGFVFRTDLRLRPDSGATPLAISTEAAETYYESVGQNWERAAMIKARPVAGDLAAGRAFLDSLAPFLWRKHLDFAAIDDIHSIKRQIHAHKGHGKIQVAGHNIKLGAGGIREIEFFAQTQQLIAGGRDPSLRVADTCGALRALAASGRVGEDDATAMIAAYHFLRTLEHRLQMVADEQTHTIPAAGPALDRVAAFAGFDGVDAFAAAVRGHLATVSEISAQLFAHATPLSSAGNLVFTGGEDDPDTLDTLRRLGFAEPERAAALVRAWHHGRYRATRSSRARALLTELVPAILEAFGRTPKPDAALVRFDEFLSRLPAGVQLFSMFLAHPELLDLVAEVLGNAPKLAGHLAQTPTLLDAVLSPDFHRGLPDRDALAADLADALARAGDFQDVLDLSRAWARDRRFQVGVQVMRGRLPAQESGRMLSDLAEVLMNALLPPVEAEFDAASGRIAGAEFAVLALGKLGARALTSGSDLDLVFLYDAPPDATSDGPRPLPAATYFARLGQRFVAALSAPTAEGALYEVDMRLRPSGASGPIATSLPAFTRYHRETAWTWERMALTRARVVVAGGAFRQRIDDEIRTVLTARRDPDALLRDVADMRARIEREKGSANPWRVKYVRGGLVDLEFLAQYRMLRDGADHPDLFTGSTAEAFTRLEQAGLLDPAQADRLRQAVRLALGIQAFLRECYIDDFDEAAATDSLKAALARAVGAPSFAGLRDEVAATQAAVYLLFQDWIERPAAALAAAVKNEQAPKTS